MAWATWLTPLEAGQSQRYEGSSDKDVMSKRRDNYNDGEVRSIRGGQVLTIIMQDSVVHHNRFLFLLFFFLLLVGVRIMGMRHCAFFAYLLI